MKKTFKRIVTGIMVIGIAAGIAACGGGSTAPTALPSSDTSGSSAVVALKIIDVGPIGTGPAAAKNVPIKVRYTGWLYDVKASNLHGTKFDSSEDRNITYDFILGIGQVIKGWDQGIEGMKRGGKRTLIIPSSLGYGVTGQGSIPSNAALVFDIELFDVDTSGSNGIVELKTTDILVGTGATAAKNNKVAVHYTGFLYDSFW